MRNKLEASALLMKQVTTQPKARNELRYAINYYSELEKIDERVYLSEMFAPNADYKQSLAKKKGNSFVNAFANAFQNTSVSKKAKGSNEYTPQELKQFLKKEHIALYFPYHKKWKGQNITPSFTYHPLNNEYVSEGWQPVSNNKTMKDTSGKDAQQWKQVTMTDEYAMNNPTMVVVPCEEGPHTDPCVGDYYVEPCHPNCGGSGGDTGSGDGVEDDLPPCQAGEECYHKVQFGWMQLTHDYDGWLAGGSKIVFASVDAIKHFPNDTDPELTKTYVSQHFSRGEINDKDWDWISAQFDQDWEGYELAKDFKIYEPDGDGLDEINLGVEVAGIGGIDFGIKLSSSRDNIFKTTYQRDQFFAENDQDFGNGTKDGEQIRSVGGVNWTMTIIPYH